jgi:hypothetical protein
MKKREEKDLLAFDDEDIETSEDEQLSAARKALNGGDKRRSVYVGRLDDFDDVADELRRIYRDARKGKIESMTAQRLSAVLTRLAAVLKVGAVEAKLEDTLRLLEAARK